MKELCILGSRVGLVKLQDQRPPCHDTYHTFPIKHMIRCQWGEIDTERGRRKRSRFSIGLPDPRGKKSLPTTLSSTDDFPELWDPKRGSKLGKTADFTWSTSPSSETQRGGRETYLSSDDGDRGEGFPQRSLAAVIAKDGAGPLDPVNEADQALHGRHSSTAKRQRNGQ